jgi:soluble lytic murein transglycosylase-like protein
MEKLFPHENDFDAEFLRAAVDTRLPVSALKGLAAMESAFNPKAYRAEYKKGEFWDASYGLMQILSRTAKGAGWSGADPKELLNPAVNLRWGSKFFAGLVARHPRYLDAVASYNMGSPRSAANTTPTIIGIYGKPGPGWTYANQPYVDRVALYTAYYQAVENGDKAKTALVLDTIKKKVIPTAPGFLALSLPGSLPVWEGRPEGWEA